MGLEGRRQSTLSQRAPSSSCPNQSQPPHVPTRAIALLFGGFRWFLTHLRSDLSFLTTSGLVCSLRQREEPSAEGRQGLWPRPTPACCVTQPKSPALSEFQLSELWLCLCGQMPSHPPLPVPTPHIPFSRLCQGSSCSRKSSLTRPEGRARGPASPAPNLLEEGCR